MIRYKEKYSQEAKDNQFETIIHGIESGKIDSYSLTGVAEEILIKIVTYKPFFIEYIKDPSEKVQLAAVKKYGLAVGVIENPSEKVQLEAVKQYPGSISAIVNPSAATQLKAVKKNAELVKHIKHPTEEVQFEAIKKDPRMIQLIQYPTEKVQLDVIRKSSIYFSFINRRALSKKTIKLQQKLYNDNIHHYK